MVIQHNPFSSKARISALGTYVPTKRLSNADFEKMVDTSDEWIVQRTGIRERRIADENQFASDLAVEAVKDMVQNYSVNLDEIDFIIVTTSTPENAFPSVASQVQAKLGLPSSVGAMDITAACAGFLYALHLANGLVSSGLHRKVLVIAAETLSKIVDYTDRTTCILFGDAAGVVLVEYDEENPTFVSSRFSTEGKAGVHLYCSNLTPQILGNEITMNRKIIQNGREIFKIVVNTLTHEIPPLVEQAGFTLNDIQWYVPHSANIRIIEAACQRLNLPMDKVLFSAEYYGNTSSATIPLAFKMGIEENKFQKGDLLLLSGFGAGFVHNSTIIRWTL